MADADAVRKQRLKHLDDKRRRLDELRQRKRDKVNFPKVSTVAAPIPPPNDVVDPDKSSHLSVGDNSNASQGVGDLDAYIKSLLEEPTPGEAAVGEDGGHTETSANTIEGPEASGGPSNESRSDRRIAERLSSLIITSELATVHILPKAVEFYDKGCQAELGGASGTLAHGNPTGDVNMEINLSHPAARKTPDKRRNHLKYIVRGKGTRPMVSTPVSKAGRLLDGVGLSYVPMTPPRPALGPVKDTKDTSSKDMKDARDKTKDLSNEKKREILQTDHFQDFLRRSSRVLERALGEKEALDVLLDYAADEGDNTNRGDQGQRLNETMTLHEDRWCQERALTDLQWSPHHPELVLASYSARGHGVDAPSSSSLHSNTNANTNTNTNTDADGLVLVWSLAMQHRPEYQLSSQSPVLTARFHPFDTHVIVGGTYSGQVVVWDTRAKSLPVQRTPLSATGHTYPVYNLHIGGTNNAPSLLTASTNGKVSTWNPSQLSQPLQDIELSHQEKPVTISSMAVAQDDEQKHLVVGSESGGIFTTPLHFRNSGAMEKYAGHYGLVTSVDANPCASKSLRGLVLSSSVDWTTRLWQLGKTNMPVQTLTHGTYDYVCDAKWSPKHPALFVTANISGELGLWNLNHSTEEPFAPPVKVVDRCALTRMAWSPDGRRLCVGDSKGYARVFNMDQETALPRPDEDLKLEATLAVKAGKGVVA